MTDKHTQRNASSNKIDLIRSRGKIEELNFDEKVELLLNILYTPENSKSAREASLDGLLTAALNRAINKSSCWGILDKPESQQK